LNARCGVERGIAQANFCGRAMSTFGVGEIWDFFNPKGFLGPRSGDGRCTWLAKLCGLAVATRKWAKFGNSGLPGIVGLGKRFCTKKFSMLGLYDGAKLRIWHLL